MEKSCNDHELVKFRANLRAYLDYYLSVMGSPVAFEPTVHLAWPGARPGISDIYKYHERNVTELMDDRQKLGRLMWFCHLRLQIVPGGLLRSPRNDLTRDILWDDALANCVPAPVPVRIEYDELEGGTHWARVGIYDTGIAVDAQRQMIYVPQGIVDAAQERALLATPEYKGVEVCISRSGVTPHDTGRL